MKQILLATLVIASAAASVSANAENIYGGVSLANSGSAQFGNQTGNTVQSNNTPTAWKLYGGYNINDTFAVEGGYLSSGTYKFPGTLTSGNQPSLDASVFYVAGKATTAINDTISAFGKLGLARDHMSTDAISGFASTDTNRTRLMAGVGAEFKLTKQLSAVVEYDYYGKVSNPTGNVTQQKLEGGLKLSF